MTYSTGKLQLENDLWFPGVQRWHNSNSDLHVGFLAANLNRIQSTVPPFNPPMVI